MTQETTLFPRSSWAFVLVIVLMVLYSVNFACLSIRRYDALEAGPGDLGNMDQAIWNTAHGRILRVTNMDVPIRLAHHVEPILIPISLLYLIYSSPKAILVLQTLVITLGALPVLWLAGDKLQNEVAAFVFAVAYLLFPPLGFANADEFHAVAMTPSFLLYAFYFAHRAHSETGKLRKRDYLLFALFAILAMSCKEEISLLVFMTGLYMFFVQKERKAGMATMAMGVMWFYTAVYVVIPHFNEKGQSPFLSYYAQWGRNPLEIAFYLLTHPQTAWQLIMTEHKLIYLYSLVAPLGFLPLFGPHIMVLALPSLGINLLSANRGMHQAHAPAHYIGPIVPFMVIASIWGASFLERRLASKLKIQRRILIYLLTGLVAVSSLYHHHYYGLSPLARGFRFHPVTPHDRLIGELVDLIPPDVAVATTLQVNSHLTRREKIYPLPDINDADYILMDITPTSSPLLANDFYLLFQNLVEHKGFGILVSKDGYILLKRGEANRRLSDGFYSFVREPNPSIKYPIKVNFDSLQLVGFNVIQDKMGTAYLELYFQALQKVERDYQFFTFITNDEGEIIVDPDEHLLEGMVYQPSAQLSAPVWYPTSQWRVGELIRIETFHWATSLPLRFGIALGVIDGLGQWEIDKRLRPEVIESGIVMPLLYDGTLLKLLTLESDGRIVEGVVQEKLFSISAIQHPLEATLGDQVKFLGHDLDATSTKPGGSLHLTLYWQALTEMDESYTVFTHLLAGDNRIWGQKDDIPGGGTRPTTSWAEGEVILDEYNVPIQIDTPPGQYMLEIGMYQLETGQRLEVRGGPEGEEDRILLGEVEVLD